MEQNQAYINFIASKTFSFEAVVDTLQPVYLDHKKEDIYLDPNFDAVDSLHIEGQFIQRDFDVPIGRLFIEKGQTKIKEVARPETFSTPIWVHLSILFWVLAVVFTKKSYFLRLQHILRNAFDLKHIKQIQREGSLLFQGFPLLLMFLNIFNLSFFAFTLLNDYVPGTISPTYFKGFLLVYGLIFLFQLGKILTIWFSGLLFKTSAVSSRYILDHYVFYITEGILLFPLLILYQYSGINLFLFSALVLLTALWLYRLLRSVIIGLGCTNFSPSYLFLYLCTLEVFPFLLLYKIVTTI
jgi:hypothetical protein